MHTMYNKKMDDKGTPELKCHYDTYLRVFRDDLNVSVKGDAGNEKCADCLKFTLHKGKWN